MAILFFLRHQKAGIQHEEPFTEIPSAQVLEDRVVALGREHGTHHPKTGETYWTKLVKVDTGKTKDDPERTVTVAGVELVVDESLPPEHPDHIVAKLVDVADIDRRGAGSCPIRDGEVEALVCEHGHNDLARCAVCAPFVRLGVPRVHVPQAIKLGLEKVKQAMGKRDPFGSADLEVSVVATGTVTNPE